MLARWFDRSGIGQYLAPDEQATKVRPVTENDEARAPIWQFLAPDSNFAPKQAPPVGAFPPRPGTNVPQVLCCHCHQWTPVTRCVTPQTPGARENPARNDSSEINLFETPTPHTKSNNAVDTLTDAMTDVETRVLSAAKDTTRTTLSYNLSGKYRSNHEHVFQCCTNASDKKIKRLRNILAKDPTLLRARAINLGHLCPDGFTPLMGCAHNNKVQVAKVLLEIADKLNEGKPDSEKLALHLDRDLQGRCAVSIAAEEGSLAMVQLLLPRHDFPPPNTLASATTTPKLFSPLNDLASPPPIDLLGRTPLGLAMLSSIGKAKTQRKQLRQTLFSPNDPSIVGEQKPSQDRLRVYSSLQMAYGTADMPGMRIIMEDAICTESWQQPQNDGLAYYSLLGVCDGHMDNGKVSEFVATNVAEILRDCMEELSKDSAVDTASSEYWSSVWQNTCIRLDDDLKKKDWEGGSTGVFALITRELIVVANVGDSRCVLIQAASSSGSQQDGSTQFGETESSHLGSVRHHADISSETPELQEEFDAPPGNSDSEIIPNPNTNEGRKLNTPSLIETSIQGLSSECVVAVPLSFDHKPELSYETARIEKAGMKVVTEMLEMGGKLISYSKIAKSEKDKLAVSRAFGDFDYKQNATLGVEEQAVSCVADVVVHKRDSSKDLYLLLACDGVWDVMTNEEAMHYILNQIKAKAQTKTSEALLPEIADDLLRECLNKGSLDNMSTILVSLQPEDQGILSPNSADLPPPKALKFAASP